MIKPVTMKTERLLLRQWKVEDYKKFSLMNADPEVMAFYPDILSESESNGLAEKIQNLITQRGWGLWAVENLQDNQFIGFVGLHKPHFELPVSPCIEIGWRLSKQYWGKGFATEAGRASLEFAFEMLNLEEVYSFTSIPNIRSRAVMERLNLDNTNANFDHPIMPDGSPLKEHVLYKISRQAWTDQK